MTKWVIILDHHSNVCPLPLPTREVESSCTEEMTLKASKEAMSTTYPAEVGKNTLIL